MHGAFGAAGGAAGVEPEARVVGAGGGRLQQRLLRGDEGIEVLLRGCSGAAGCETITLRSS